jgi:DNA polymerase III alpha subunit
MMMFMSMEDLEGMLEVVFFPQIYQQFRLLLRQSGPFLVRGIVEQDDTQENVWIRAEKVKVLESE